jgi:peptide/nickel transport system substrate-binding protein
VVVLACSTIPSIHAIVASQVATDVLRRIGMNIDMQLARAREWRGRAARQREAPEKGGWSIFYTSLGGMGNVSPGPNLPLRANGADAWFGWPDDPKMEALRETWFEAADQEARQKICRRMQEEF